MKVILRLLNLETLCISMSVDYKYVYIFVVLLIKMNYSYLIAREEVGDLEQHIRTLLCSDGKHLSLVVVVLLVVVALVRLFQLRYETTRGARHNPVAQNIDN